MTPFVRSRGHERAFRLLPSSPESHHGTPPSGTATGYPSSTWRREITVNGTPSSLQRKPATANPDWRPADRSIRVVIADDQAIDRRGLLLLLETQPDLDVVADAASGEEAIDRCRELSPDVLVLDLRMPVRDGISTITHVRSVAPRTRILCVAERGEARCLALNPPKPNETWQLRDPRAGTPVSDCLQVAVHRGAHGAIRRSAQPAELFQAIRALAAGNAWYESGTAARLHGRASSEPDQAQLLSARELEVVTLISDGRSNKEIASALAISDRTVKKHVTHVLRKLELEDRLQIGLFVARNPLFLESRQTAKP